MGGKRRRSADRKGEKGRKEIEGKEGNNEERKEKEPVSDRP